MSFIFNGTSSDSLGVNVLEKEPYTSSERSVEFVEVHGRDGAIVLDHKRYTDTNTTYTCFVIADGYTDLAQKLEAVRAWLYGANRYCRLVDSYNPNRYRLAMVQGALSPAIIADGQGAQFTVTFRCKPYWYDVNGDIGINIRGGTILTNPSIVDAKPLIEFGGTGTLTITNTLGAKSWIVGIAPTDSSLICDSELMEWHDGTHLLNQYIEGDGFPVLTIGENRIQLDGGMTCNIKPRWRYL